MADDRDGLLFGCSVALIVFVPEVVDFGSDGHADVGFVVRHGVLGFALECLRVFGLTEVLLALLWTSNGERDDLLLLVGCEIRTGVPALDCRKSRVLDLV